MSRRLSVLALNCGSSSVKFQLVELEERGGPPDPGRRVLSGCIDRFGPEAVTVIRGRGAPERTTSPVPDHETAVGHAVAAAARAVASIQAVGHRVVHGGERFMASTLVDDQVVAAIETMEELAPLHNEPGLAGIRGARRALGSGVPMAAVFDTTFHATLPPRAASYAIPPGIAARHGIRRFGFHGTAYRHLLARYCGLAGVPPEGATLVALHLGSGASAAAIRNGECVDTSMGLTPLEGLVMGTRAGDIDASVVPLLARRAGMSLAEVDRLLHLESGLLGLSGRTADMRDLLEREAADPRARLAVDLFCYRARKYLGAYLAALGGADAVVFSGGIGENAPEVRARIAGGMAWCGLELDPWRNRRIVGREGEIGAAGAPLRALVIPADEGIVIARDTAALVFAAGGRGQEGSRA
ncbi:MAG TPA: acetate/propionate family kinase [Candidatus Polarisedimenticolia bacterium]|nr:acetate/propionate family kinase [Candidatus Polarisedimenticolia bacterium]